MTGAINMPSTKKCLHSPDIDGLLSTCQSVLIQTHQSALVKRHSRGPKDNCIKALEKLKCRHCYQVFQGIADNLNTACDSQLNTHMFTAWPLHLSTLLSSIALGPQCCIVHLHYLKVVTKTNQGVSMSLQYPPMSY